MHETSPIRVSLPVLSSEYATNALCANCKPQLSEHVYARCSGKSDSSFTWPSWSNMKKYDIG